MIQDCFTDEAWCAYDVCWDRASRSSPFSRDEQRDEYVPTDKRCQTIVESGAREQRRIKDALPDKESPGRVSCPKDSLRQTSPSDLIFRASSSPSD